MVVEDEIISVNNKIRPISRDQISVIINELEITERITFLGLGSTLNAVATAIDIRVKGKNALHMATRILTYPDKRSES